MSALSRRHFLQGSGLSATALVFGTDEKKTPLRGEFVKEYMRCKRILPMKLAVLKLGRIFSASLLSAAKPNALIQTTS